MGKSGRDGMGDLLQQHHPQGSRPDPWGPARLMGPCSGLPARPVRSYRGDATSRPEGAGDTLD